MILTMILTDKPDFAPPPEFAPYDGHYSRIQLLEQGNETIMCMYLLKKLRTGGTKNSYVYRPNFYSLNWKLTEQQQKEGIFTSNSADDPEIAFDAVVGLVLGVARRRVFDTADGVLVGMAERPAVGLA
ncbi:MAG: hypothetical protein MJK04_32185, partial [Psychrosphaera sp.]|nr:hypothetical protein [Psychrosphaera sp.]